MRKSLWRYFYFVSNTLSNHMQPNSARSSRKRVPCCWLSFSLAWLVFFSLSQSKITNNCRCSACYNLYFFVLGWLRKQVDWRQENLNRLLFGYIIICIYVQTIGASSNFKESTTKYFWNNWIKQLVLKGWNVIK